MSKDLSRTVFTHESKSEDKSVSAWDRAITDAEGMIAEKKKQIADLKRSVEGFKYLRDSGAPFPGESAEQAESEAV